MGRIIVEFDHPQSVSWMVYEVEECACARTQEVSVEVSPDGGRTYRQMLVPEYTFSRDLVPRQNYRQVKKQKELSRKARQLEKQQRRTARPDGSGEVVTSLHDPPAGPSDPTLSSGT
jgi:hypothetical protein